MRTLVNWLLCAVLMWAMLYPARAIQDVPRDHWAYEAVQGLASKGMIKGYPPDRNFFGNRTVTRYEMATLIQRVLAYVDDRLAQAPPLTPSTTPPAQNVVSAEELADIRRLVNEFKIELGIIGTDLARVREEIGEFRQELAQVRSTAEKAAADAATAHETANATRTEVVDIIETLTLQRSEFEQLSKNVKSHQISGYLQARYEMFDTGQSSLFPKVGATGGPAVGGPHHGMLVRRARLKIGGS